MRLPNSRPCMSVKAVTTVSIVPVLGLLAQVVDREHPGGAAGAAGPRLAHGLLAPRSLSPRVTSSSSSVRTGPVYLFFADTAHQIADEERRSRAPAACS